VVEEQVDEKIVAVDHDPLLPRDEAGTEFEDAPLDVAQDRGLQVLLAVGVLEAEEVE